MDNDESVRLIAEYQKGNDDAGNQVLIGNSRLAINLAFKIANRTGGDVEDAISYAMLALLKAIRRYNPAGCAKFSTYAYKSIVRKVYTYLAYDITGRWDQKTTDFNVKFKYIDEDNFFHGKILKSDYNFNNSDNNLEIGKLLKKLNKDDRDIIESRYGVKRERHTLDEIAQKYKITREGARQRINRIIQKIRKNAIDEEYYCDIKREMNE